MSFRPDEVLVDPEGNIWVADASAGRILGASRDGAVHTEIAAPELRGPHGLALDRAGGRLYVADPAALRVWQIELGRPGGAAPVTPVAVAGAAVFGSPELPGPASSSGLSGPASAALPPALALALDEDERGLYLACAGAEPASGRVARLNLDNGTISLIGHADGAPCAPAPPALDLALGGAGFDRPRGLALSPDRARLYVADADAVYWIELATGAVTCLAGPRAPTPPRPRADDHRLRAVGGLTLAPAGLVVTDPGAGALRGVNLRHGTVVTIWPGRGQDPLCEPVAVAFDRTDLSYVVAERGNDRLLRIARDAACARPIELHSPHLPTN